MNSVPKNQGTVLLTDFNIQVDGNLVGKYLLKLLNGNHLLLSDFEVEELQWLLYSLCRKKIPTSFVKAIGAKQEKKSLTLVKKLEEKTVTPKTCYLVFKNQKYYTVKTEDIAYFYIFNNGVNLVSFDKKEYCLNQSLKQITESVSDKQFCRINRKYLINFNAIKEVEHYYNRKLCVILNIATPEVLLINKENATSFLSWLGER